MGRPVKRSVKIAGHPTSISLEEPFWAALREVAEARGCSVASLVEEIDRGRQSGLSTAIRLFILEEFKRRAAGPS